MLLIEIGGSDDLPSVMDPQRSSIACHRVDHSGGRSREIDATAARAGLERSALRKHKRKRWSGARSQANRVTEFTLTLWLYMDMRFAQMQNLKLGRSECVGGSRRSEAIEAAGWSRSVHRRRRLGPA